MIAILPQARYANIFCVDTLPWSYTKLETSDIDTPGESSNRYSFNTLEDTLSIIRNWIPMPSALHRFTRRRVLYQRSLTVPECIASVRLKDMLTRGNPPLHYQVAPYLIAAVAQNARVMGCAQEANARCTARLTTLDKRITRLARSLSSHSLSSQQFASGT